MARRKARNPSPPQTYITDETERAFPSSPKVPARFCIHFRYPHDAPIGEGRRMTETFVGAYAARKFIEYMVGGEEAEWPNLHTMITSSGVMIYCTPPTNRMVENDLEKALNHDYTSAEEEWALPDLYKNKADLFKRPWVKPEMEAQATRSTRSTKGVPKPYGELTSVSDLCEQLGIKPRDGRAALRKSNIKKPAYGWQFMKDSPELVEVETFLKGITNAN